MWARTCRSGMAVIAIAMIAAGCRTSASGVSGSATTTTVTSPAPANPDSRLTEHLDLRNGDLLVDPAPSGQVPAVSAADAVQRVPTGAFPGQTPTAVFGLATTPHTGQGKPGGGITPMLDHQLVWIVWYCTEGDGCGSAGQGPNVRDGFFVVDAQTGKGIVILPGSSS